MKKSGKSEKRLDRRAVLRRGHAQGAGGAHDGPDRRGGEGEIGDRGAQRAGRKQPLEPVYGERAHERRRVLAPRARRDELSQVSHLAKARRQPPRRAGDSPMRNVLRRMGETNG